MSDTLDQEMGIGFCKEVQIKRFEQIVCGKT
jgi:hypothetical protein